MDQTEQQTPEINSYSLNSWMYDLHPYIKNLTIRQLSIPGSHNAGMDREIVPNDSYNYFQDYKILTQLNNGIRVLDLRFKYFFGNPGGYGNKLKTFHSAKTGRSLDDIKSDVNVFLTRNPDEFVIFDIQKIEDRDGTSQNVPWREINNFLMDFFGSRLLPRSADGLTLEQIRKQHPGRCIIIATPNEIRNEGNEEHFWFQIKHQWAGDGLVDEKRLEEHISSVMDAPPPGFWSMSATAYNIGGPVNINTKLCEWYPTNGDWQRKSNIINFDWVTRNNNQLIHQCILSNKLSGAPDNFRGAIYGELATFTWDPLPNVVKYEIVTLLIVVVDSTPNTHISIPAPKVALAYTVRAVYENGTKSGHSKPVLLTPTPQQPPAQPQNITYRVIRGNVTFNWDAVPRAIKYEVLRDDLPINTVAETTTTTAGIHGARYNFAAIDENDLRSPYSETITVSLNIEKS